jgi:hypothetical protein
VLGVCGILGGARLLRLGPGRGTQAVRLGDDASAVFSDGTSTWVVGFPSSDRTSGYIRRLGYGRHVALPAGFGPNGVTGGVVAGNLGSVAAGGGSVLFVDAATGEIRANLGQGQVLAVGAGVVVWTDPCDPISRRPCPAHWRSVRGGRTSHYRLPRPTAFSSGVVSPDGRTVVFTLERANPDERYLEGHPFPPSEIAVLHLDTDRLELVPGVELPAKSAPGFAFTPDSRWLAITLNAGTRTRVLLWRPGLAHPYETASVPGLALSPPAIAASGP